MTPVEVLGHELALAAPPLTAEQVEGLARILATVEPKALADTG